MEYCSIPRWGQGQFERDGLWCRLKGSILWGDTLPSLHPSLHIYREGLNSGLWCHLYFCSDSKTLLGGGSISPLPHTHTSWTAFSHPWSGVFVFHTAQQPQCEDKHSQTRLFCLSKWPCQVAEWTQANSPTMSYLEFVPRIPKVYLELTLPAMACCCPFYCVSLSASHFSEYSLDGGHPSSATGMCTSYFKSFCWHHLLQRKGSLMKDESDNIPLNMSVI